MASSVAASPIEIHCQGVLFDMDGILISSLGSVERSWAKWGQMRGVDAALAIKTAHGCRAIETVAKLRPDLDSEAELKVIEEIEIEDNEGLSVLPGVLTLLQALTHATAPAGPSSPRPPSGWPALAWPSAESPLPTALSRPTASRAVSRILSPTSTAQRCLASSRKSV
jgi:beta-phosphoglucomutase-like phosphatase (HAD superfamily)